jgi:hypothetical protein
MGCGTTTRVSMLRPVDYEPVVADSVEVFFASGDIRGPYQEIAVITAVPTSSADAKIDTGDETAIIQALREKAGEVGADAIIVRDISPRPDEPDFLRGWAVAIRTGVDPQELRQVPEPAAVMPPWAPPPIEAPPPVTPPRAATPVGEPASVEVRESREPSLVIHVLAGTGLGALTGFLFGGMADLIVEEGFDADSDPDPNAYCYNHDCWLEGAIIVGAAGAVIGLVVWAVKKASSADQGQPRAALDRLRVSVAPQREGRFGLGLSVRF